MKKNMNKGITIFVLFAVVLCAVFMFAEQRGKQERLNSVEAAAGGSDIIQVASESNTHKVALGDAFPETEAEIKVSLAKGESEGAQLILKSTEDISTFDIEITELTSEEGHKVSTECVQVYFLKYMDAMISQFEPGYYPDAMIPFESAVLRGENLLSADIMQGIWFTISVPDNQEAGIYRGTYSIVADEEEVTIPVQVEVYDFELPQAPSLKSVYLIWRDWLIDGELKSGTKIYRTYYEFLKDYRIDAYEFPAENGDIEGFIVDMQEYYDTSSTFCIPHTKVSAGSTQYEGTTYSLYTIDEEQMAEYLYAIARVSSNETNYFSKAYYYIHDIIDEASSNIGKQLSIEKVYESLDDAEETAIQKLENEDYFNDSNVEIKESIRNIKSIMVSSYMEEYEDIIDLWCPTYSAINTTQKTEFYRELSKQEGKELFSYGCIGVEMPFNSFFIEDDLISCRDKSWQEYVCNATGDLYWCVNDYVDLNVAFGTQYGRLKDFYTEDADRDAVNNKNICGDGYLLYPGTPYGLDKPIASLRLEAIRDGSEDHDYMMVLEDCYKELAGALGKQSARSVIEMMTKEINTHFVSTYNHEGIQIAREVIARLIEAAKKGKFVIEETILTDTEIQLVCDIESGWEIYANGTLVTAKNGKYTVIADRGVTLSIEVKKGTDSINIQLPVSAGYEVASNFVETTSSALTIPIQNGRNLKGVSMSVYNPTSTTQLVKVKAKTSDGKMYDLDSFEIEALEQREWVYYLNPRKLKDATLSREDVTITITEIEFAVVKDSVEDVAIFFEKLKISR